MNNTYVCTSLKQLSTIIHMKSVMGECHIKLSTTYVGVFIHPKESALQLSLRTVTYFHDCLQLCTLVSIRCGLLWEMARKCMSCSPGFILSSCLFLCSSRHEADQGCKQAEEQKRVVESSLSALRDQEEEARLSLCQLKEEMQRDKQQLHQLKSELKKREKQALKYVYKTIPACAPQWLVL